MAKQPKFEVETLPFAPPLEPMLAKTGKFPSEAGWLFEPKWDGFRTLVWREGERVYLQSRDKKPMLRYFPELEAPLRDSLPSACVLDGELVVAIGEELDFGALQQRIHPAKSRVQKLSEQTPASFVAFDLLALNGDDLRDAPQIERRRMLETVLGEAAPPVHVTPMTRDVDVAREWFERFEGAGLDGVIAKPETLTYQPKKRAMRKIKHVRTCDAVVGGFRWHKKGPGELVGSLLLGLYDADGALHHVGVTSSFKMDHRRALVSELEPWREGALDGHPWADWAAAQEDEQRKPGMTSRWNAKKDLSWVPLRAERVCEVKFDHLEGGRFRHTATFLRWRDDKPPAECTYDQIDVTPPYDLKDIFGR